MNQWKSWLAIIGLIVIFGIVAVTAPRKAGNSTNSNKTSPEIQAILNLKTTQEQTVELKKLLERVGPVEAQEQMVVSGLPFTGETHLLIHVIGDYVYDKYGLEGLSMCREYFLSACYHGFIINALADYGIDGVADAIESCEVVGGPTVSAQCAHAAGHGFVAWHNYDLLKALKNCDELGGKVDNFGYFNCYDGVFMENVWGVHDGTLSDKRWVKENDVNYPCNDPRIPDKYLNGCWSNQATLAYQHFHGDLRKTAVFCDTVANETYKATCHNNLARQIHPITQGSVDKVLELCSIETSPRWQDDCIIANMTSYWSVGDHDIPFSICAVVSSPLKETCLGRLANLIAFYYKGQPERKRSYCARITDVNIRKLCEN